MTRLNSMMVQVLERAMFIWADLQGEYELKDPKGVLLGSINVIT